MEREFFPAQTMLEMNNIPVQTYLPRENWDR